MSRLAHYTELARFVGAVALLAAAAGPLACRREVQLRVTVATADAGPRPSAPVGAAVRTSTAARPADAGASAR